MRKRSKYRPRPVVNDTMYYILSGNLPATAAKTVITRIRVANHSAMDSLIHGKGTVHDVDVLGHMLTTAMALAKHSIGRDWLPELSQARKELDALEARGGHYTMRASEIMALNLALEIHDAQLDGCTIKQLEDATNAAMKAMRCGHEVRELA